MSTPDLDRTVLNSLGDFKAVQIVPTNPEVPRRAILVNNEWLKTCGLEAYADMPLPVTRVDDHGPRGKFYTVELPHLTPVPPFVLPRTWMVWDVRGITETEIAP